MFSFKPDLLITREKSLNEKKLFQANRSTVNDNNLI